MMKTAFITGTNGLLGNNLIIELTGAGYQVKGLVRDRSKYKGPPSPDLDLIEGALFDDLTGAMSGAGVVIHAAAETSQSLNKYQPYKRINVEATLNLLDCAIRAGVRKFIFVSSANSIGCPGNLQELGCESNPICPPYDKSFYAVSKEEAEREILHYKECIDITIVNPTFMLGAYDTKPSSGRIISMGSGKPVIFYTPGGKNFVYVRDVAKGIVNAVELGKNGERYLLCNENLTLKQFFRKLNGRLGKRPLLIGVPKGILLFAGKIGDLLQTIGIKTELSSANMGLICHKGFYSNEKSIKELNIEYHPIEYAIDETLNYFQLKK